MSYRKRQLKNKIYKIRPKKSIFKKPAFWFLLLFLILISTAVYFLLFYQKLQVKNIIISGNEKAGSQEIENIVLNETNKKIINFLNFNLTSKSIFLVNTENIKKQVLNMFPVIENIKIDKNYPNSISVQIKERKPFAVFVSQNNEDYFYIDEGGIVFEKLQGFPQNMTAIRQLINSADAVIGKTAVEKNIMQAISSIKKDLSEKFQIDIREAFISNPLRLDIKTGENWQIYFNLGPDTDINLQITKLNLLLAGEISQEARKNLEYIDLRFDRAYYK